MPPRAEDGAGPDGRGPPTAARSAALLHGGAVMTLADSVGAVCAFLNLPEGASTSTIESKTNFFRGVRDGEVVATARPLHVGRTTIVVQTDSATATTSASRSSPRPKPCSAPDHRALLWRSPWPHKGHERSNSHGANGDAVNVSGAVARAPICAAVATVVSGARNVMCRVEVNVAAAPMVGSVFGTFWFTVEPLAPYWNASPVHWTSAGVLSST